MKKCVIGTRASRLAQIQAQAFGDQLIAEGIEVEWKQFKTSGDQWLEGPLDSERGNGFFTREIDQALLDGSIDLAIHSFKDVPLSRPNDFIQACIPQREDPHDWLVHREELKPHDVIATSSTRRTLMLRHHYPQFSYTWIRGNVTTRIERLRKGLLREAPFHATVLAAAGIRRLGLTTDQLKITPLPYSVCVPAPAQGALLAECRKESIDLVEALKPLHCSSTQKIVTLERAVLELFGGGCQLPLGVLISQDSKKIFHAVGMWASENFVRKVELSDTNPSSLINDIFQQLSI